MNMRIGVSRELLNNWLQDLKGVPEDSPAMRVAHSIIALLKDSVYVPRSDELRAAGAKVVDVPVIPVQPAPNYRIQIEDGAWVGTLDEWRALLKLSGKRAMPRWEECMFMGPPPAGHASWNQWANGPVLAGAYIRRIEPGDYKVTGIKVEGDTANPAPATAERYNIVFGGWMQELENRVNSFIVEGWACQGGPSVSRCADGSLEWMQAMVRK